MYRYIYILYLSFLFYHSFFLSCFFRLRRRTRTIPARVPFSSTSLTYLAVIRAISWLPPRLRNRRNVQSYAWNSYSDSRFVASCRQGPVANGYLETGSSDVLQDPWYELGDPGTHAWQIGLRATNSPGYDASEEVPTVFPSYLERTTRITLKITRKKPFWVLETRQKFVWFQNNINFNTNLIFERIFIHCRPGGTTGILDIIPV